MAKYDESSVGIVDPVSHVRRRKVMYLGREEVAPEDLATNLVNDALTLGVASVEVHHCGDWWMVSCAEDWLARENDFTIEETFRSIVPLVGGGLEASRREILLTAFASDVFAKKGEDMLWVSGGTHIDHDQMDTCLKMIPGDHRVVGFRCSPSRMR
jgi:hypothetical protein